MTRNFTLFPTLPRPAFRAAALAFAVLATPFGAGVASAKSEGFGSQHTGYVRVTGLAKGKVVWVRSDPSPNARKVGLLPAKARYIRTFGCKRVAVASWCEVQYRGTRGWVSKRYLRPDHARRAKAGSSLVASCDKRRGGENATAGTSAIGGRISAKVVDSLLL